MTLGDVVVAAASCNPQRLELYVEMVDEGQRFPPYVPGGVTLRVMRFEAGASSGREFAGPWYVSVGAEAACSDLASVLQEAMGLHTARQLWVGRHVTVGLFVVESVRRRGKIR